MIDILSDCKAPEKPANQIKLAGKVVCIDLMNPIDVSQMRVDNTSCLPEYDNFGRVVVEREVQLSTHIQDENGTECLLEITFTLKGSQRMPKIDKGDIWA